MSLREKILSIPRSSRSWEKSSEGGLCFAAAGKDRARYYAAACCVCFLLGLLFYRSAWAGLIACLASFPLERYYQSFYAEKRREGLLAGFKDALYTISGAVSAGRQMPSAIRLAAKSSKESFGADSDICRELLRIDEKYGSTNADMGQLLLEFAERSGIDEIGQFASVYVTCQRCGGDLELACLKCSELLMDRISLKNETRSLIDQKKLDVALLTAMPVVILLGLNLINYAYVSVLYETAAGRVVMSLCLLLIASALLWGIKITGMEL
ncbi:MAG: hypothetical protein IKX89_04230 [Firmicutes bacterium]|nr:hypothetical protein [Bacillota bacterium]